MATVPIFRADDTVVTRVRIPPSGKKSIGLHGGLEVGVLLTAEDIVYPGDRLLYVPARDAAGSDSASALPVISSPVRPSKRFKASLFQGKTRCVAVHEIVGSERLETVAALNWLWLHVFGASVTLSIFVSTTHEKRYYPYVLAVAQAAALGGQGRTEIAGGDNKTSVPDIQVIIDGKDMIPLDVKKLWGHGSVDDPHGIARNADTLNQLLRSVLEYNKEKVGDYSCTTAVIIRLHFVFFLRFHISKKGASDLGSLELLEHAPGFTRGTRHKMSEAAGLWEVKLINIAGQLNSKFGLRRKWSEETLRESNLPGPLVNRLQNTALQVLLPACPPEGFHSLVKYFRTLAPQCFIPVVFVYESQDGTVEVCQVLASGPKSCVFATTGMSSILKVSSEDYIELDIRPHRWVDSADCIYLRKMVGHGRVVGAGPGLNFVELEGVGFPFARKHMSTREQIVKCWKEASSAIKALHGQSVFHRDIKPSNFIVMKQGTEQRLVLNDFDCAAHWEENMSSDVGTASFQSPLLEQCGDYCCRDDWLSLGLSFAHLLGLVPERVELSRQRKLDILENLCSYPLIPEEMKVTMELALSEEHVCCYRVVRCALSEYSD